jgi:hypothetical protein
MSDLERRGGSRLSRRSREDRAFRLAVAGGTFGVIAVVGFVLVLFTSVSAGIPLIAAIVAIACLLMFRRTVGS